MKTVSATAFTGVYTGVTLYASDKSGVCFLFALTKLKQLVSLLSCCKTLRHLSDVPGNASHVTRHRLTPRKPTRTNPYLMIQPAK